LSPATRFDVWTTEDVYTALETMVSEVTHSLDHYRQCDAQQKAQVLALTETRLLTALEATRTLRRRAAQRF